MSIVFEDFVLIIKEYFVEGKDAQDVEDEHYMVDGLPTFYEDSVKKFKSPYEFGDRWSTAIEELLTEGKDLDFIVERLTTKLKLPIELIKEGIDYDYYKNEYEYDIVTDSRTREEKIVEKIEWLIGFLENNMEVYEDVLEDIDETERSEDGDLNYKLGFRHGEILGEYEKMSEIAERLNKFLNIDKQ